MITGDHRDTAVAIARQLGILQEEKQALTGRELSDMTDEELTEKIDRFTASTPGCSRSTRYALYPRGSAGAM